MSARTCSSVPGSGRRVRQVHLKDVVASTLVLLALLVTSAAPTQALDPAVATAAELLASGAVDLPMARRIVMYRAIHRPTDRASWLLLVPGVSPEIAQKILSAPAPSAAALAAAGARHKAACGNVSDDYRILVDRVTERDPELAQLLGGDQPPIEAVHAALRDMTPPGTRVLEFIAGETELQVFVLSAVGMKSFALLVNREQLENLTARFWMMMMERMENPTEHLQRTRELAKILYGMILKPIEAEIGGEGELLYIVMDGPLYYLPFQALINPRTDRYLIQERPIAYIPTAATLEYALLKSRPISESFRGFAVPEVPGWSPIMATIPEVRVSARFFSDAVIRERGEATIAAAKLPVPRGGVLHFACHGSIGETDPMTGSIRLHPGPSSDGALTLNEIAALDYSEASLAVLSACETNIDGGATGGRAVLALSRSFLYAGVPAVIASQWAVSDEAAPRVMVSFYDAVRNRGLSKAQAFQIAQRYVLEETPYRHPRYWAALQLIGDCR